MKVSHSKVKLARKCRKAYQYRYIDKLRKRVKSKPLLVGSLIHSCLEAYFRDGHYLPEIRKWKEKEYNKMFREEQALNADIIPLTKTLMRGYVKNWKESGMEMVWVEKEFELEIDPEVTLVGKIDGKARDTKKRNWLVEHKTCKNMPGEEVRMFDIQAIIYGKVLKEMGEPVSGVMWDYLRKKLPAKPELSAKGGLSKRKNIDTTPEVYKREIKRHGLDVEGYQDILEELESRKDGFFRQIYLPFNENQATRLMEEVAITGHHLIELENLHEQGVDCFDRNLTKDCSWCDYSTLCYAELRGDDVEHVLKHEYEVKDEKVNSKSS